MLKRMLKTIERYNMLSWGDHVAVGLSGGADSVALLFLLLECAKIYGVTVSAVHVNHGIRGHEAERDEAFVAKLCKNKGIRLYTRREDVPALAAARKTTVEEAGRIVRQNVYNEALAKLGANKIALGHHKNDNAETLLMRFCRGTGLTGLAGIPPVRGSLIRPLINSTRRDIERYCLENNIEFIQDGTNLDDAYTRNFIRLRLIPMIERRLNPSVVEALCRSAALCQEDGAYLDQLAAEAFKSSSVGRNGGIYLNTEVLSSLPPPILRRVLRLALLKLNHTLQNITYEHILDITNLLGENTGKSVCLPHGIRAEATYDHLFIYIREEESLGFCYNLPIGKPLVVKETGMIVTANFEKPEAPLENGCTMAFSYDKINNELQIRSTRPGDRIYFKQIGGHKKLKSYFAERKLWRGARADIALLANGSDILWVMDEKPAFSSDYSVTEETNEILYITVWKEYLDNEK